MKLKTIGPAERRATHSLPFAILSTIVALVIATPALAQISRVGSSTPAKSASVRGTCVAYDPAHQVYLVAGAYGYVWAAFVNTSGAPISSFTVGTANPNSPFAHFPACAYSPDLNGGAGGFLVVWHQNDGQPNFVHGIVVSYPTGIVGSEQIFSGPGTWWESSPSVAYSASSHQFLIAWTSYVNDPVGGSWQVKGRLGSSTGTPVGSVFTIGGNSSSSGSREASVAWNAATNEFGVGWTGWNASGSIAVFQRRNDTDGSAAAGATTFDVGTGCHMAAVDVNQSNHHYVMGYTKCGGIGSRYAEFDQNGSLVGGPALFSSHVGSYDSMSLSFNPQSGTFLAAGQSDLGLEVVAREAGGSGAPIGTDLIATNGAAPNGGSFYPQVGARSDAKQWAISYARDFTAITDQIIATGSSSTPAGGVQLIIDAPSQNQGVGNPFYLSGWAVDTRASVGNGIDTLHIWAVPKNGAPAIFMGVPAVGQSRPDIGQQFGSQFTNSGFGAYFSHLPAGSYTIVVYPHSAFTNDFDFSKVKTVDVTIGAGPLTVIDTPGWGQVFNNGGNGNLTVNGFAIDTSYPTGPGVNRIDVWAINAISGAVTFLGQATLGISRPDVGQAFGHSRFDPSGFSFTNTTTLGPPGPYFIAMFSFTTGSSSPNIARIIGVNIQ